MGKQNGKHRDFKRGEGVYGKPSKDRGKSNCSQYVDNAVEYYNKYPINYATAFDYPWFKIIGQDIPYTSIVRGASTGSDSNYGGIMLIDYVPTFGVSTDVNSPVNRCFNQLMQDLYAKTSGANLDFQAADLAMMLTSTSSIAIAIGELDRALKISEFWITKNANYPRVLLHSMGFSWDDITSNKPAYVERLNSLKHMFNHLQIPAFMDIFKRQFALSSNVYVDEDDEFGQIYAFRSTHIYMYDDEHLKATAEPIADGMSLRLAQIEQALNYWYNSKDFWIINGALLRAYKNAPTMFIEDITTTTMLDPAKPEHILTQIMNMDINGYDFVDGSLDITQNPVGNYVIWQPAVANNLDYTVMDSKLIRLFNDNPSRDDNCECTRLTTAWSAFDGTQCTLNSIQTELVTKVSIFCVGSDFSSSGLLGSTNTNILPLFRDGNAPFDGVGAEAYAFIAAVMPFRYLPCLIVDMTAYSETGVTSRYRIRPYSILGDMYNYTTISSDQVHRMNEVALLSLWKAVEPTF